MLNISRNSQENTFVGISFLKTESNTGAFLWVLRNFKNIYIIEHLRWLLLDITSYLKNWSHHWIVFFKLKWRNNKGYSNSVDKELNLTVHKSSHCVKWVLIRSYSGPYSVRVQENTDQNNSKYGYFPRSVIYDPLHFIWMHHVLYMRCTNSNSTIKTYSAIYWLNNILKCWVINTVHSILELTLLPNSFMTEIPII